MDSMGALYDADMFRCLQQNGNGESPTTNPSTILLLLSLQQLTSLLVKWFWGCYFWNCCSNAGIKTMAWRETFTRYYRDDPTVVSVRLLDGQTDFETKIVLKCFVSDMSTIFR
jgi:hypothetical protein